jgi:hypothetical protein
MRFSLRVVQAFTLFVLLTTTVGASPRPGNVPESLSVERNVVWWLLGKMALPVARFFGISPLDDYPTPPRPISKRGDLPPPPKPISKLEDQMTPPKP